MRAKPNAQHLDEPKGSYLHIRVTQEQKARWVKQAQARGVKLSAWVCEKLDESHTSMPDNPELATVTLHPTRRNAR